MTSYLDFAAAFFVGLALLFTPWCAAGAVLGGGFPVGKTLNAGLWIGPYAAIR